jgi:DNA-binding NarL/FixJ family response regulator
MFERVRVEVVVVTNRTDWEIPTLESTYSNYVKRRTTILNYLVDGKSIAEIAALTSRSQNAVYTDLTKIKWETETYNVWGALVVAIKRGWVELP